MKLKQLFCRHVWYWTNPYHFVVLTGEMPENVEKCRKCGQRIDVGPVAEEGEKG